MIGKKCLKSLLVFGGIMSVFAFGKTALADEVPVIKGDDGKYDISCIVQAPEGSRWLTNYFLKVPFTIESVDEKNPKASVETINVPDARSMEEGGAKFDVTKGMWTTTLSTQLSFEKFEHTGVYVYKLKKLPYRESSKMVYSTEVYTVRVFVVDNGEGPVIKGVTAEESGLKKSKVSFTDSVFPRSSLSVYQRVSGDLADKTKVFKYVAMFEKPAFVGEKEAGEVKFSKGAKGTEDAIVPFGKEFVFNMKAGEKANFYYPSGVHGYVYKKCAKDGYIPKRSGYKDSVGKRHEEQIGKDSDYNFPLTSDIETEALKKVLFGDGGGTTIYVTDVATNDVPLTGLFLDEKSGVMMVAIALGSLVALGAGAVVYKKRASDR